MTQSLSEFFRDKKQRSDSEVAGIDWARRKSEWLEAVRELYRIVDELVAEARAQGLVSLSRRPKEITENHLGAYSVDELVLTVGDEEVIFSPRGRNIAGTQGRVDVRGESGEATLVVQPGPRWSIVASRYPQLRLTNLDGETFAEMLQGITRR